MNEKNVELASGIVKQSYIKLGQNSITKRQNILKEILSQRQLPEDGLDDITIRYFLNTFALMDSNNFSEKVGVGERESRIFSNLVLERHFYMGHGIGRSGDIMANQPKAAGSSLLLQMARFLTVSALKQLHYQFVHDVLLMPLATGMSLALAFLVLAQMQPQKKYVIWSRIDQKTCLKSIGTANLKPIVVELRQSGDYLVCDHQAIQAKIQQIGAERILCIVSTTSCFAPRIPDDVEKNSEIAKKYKVYHVVNNSYGIWCSKIANKIKQGFRTGQCTIVVQSTDKNFMVPVGGSLIFTQNKNILQKISAKYPGRANASPIVDMFITLLSIGKKSIHRLQRQRKQCFQHMKTLALDFANKNNCKLLDTPGNTISMAMSIKNLNFKDPGELGSILYSKRVMGHRIVKLDQKTTKIMGYEFQNYGSHINKYSQLPYITFASALGTKKQELDSFFERLHRAVKELNKKQAKQQQKTQEEEKKSQGLQIKEKQSQLGGNSKKQEPHEQTKMEAIVMLEQQQFSGSQE